MSSEMLMGLIIAGVIGTLGFLIKWAFGRVWDEIERNKKHIEKLYEGQAALRERTAARKR